MFVFTCMPLLLPELTPLCTYQSVTNTAQHLISSQKNTQNLHFIYFSHFACNYWLFYSLSLQTTSVMSHPSRHGGMWTLVVGARLQSSCSALPSYSWLPSCLYSAQSEESPRNGLSWLDHRPPYPATPPLKEHFFKKKIKKKKKNTDNLSQWKERGRDFDTEAFIVFLTLENAN